MQNADTPKTFSAPMHPQKHFTAKQKAILWTAFSYYFRYFFK